MSINLNPYDVLGVKRDATTDEITRAYRARVKKAHPDAGGVADEFSVVNKCALVLRDPKLRERYDRTGQWEEAPVNNDVGLAIAIIAGVVSQAVTQFCAGQARDPATFDLVEMCRQAITHKIAELQQQKVNAIKLASEMERLSKRFRSKKKNDPISDAMVRSIAFRSIEYHRGVQKTDTEIEAHQRALKYINDLVFDVETAQQFTQYFYVRAV